MEIREDLPTSTIRERLIYEACSLATQAMKTLDRNYLVQ
jgi:hypothetical protein